MSIIFAQDAMGKGPRHLLQPWQEQAVSGCHWEGSLLCDPGRNGAAVWRKQPSQVSWQLRQVSAPRKVLRQVWEDARGLKKNVITGWSTNLLSTLTVFSPFYSGGLINPLTWSFLRMAPWVWMLSTPGPMLQSLVICGRCVIIPEMILSSFCVLCFVTPTRIESLVMLNHECDLFCSMCFPWTHLSLAILKTVTAVGSPIPTCLPPRGCSGTSQMR